MSVYTVSYRVRPICPYTLYPTGFAPNIAGMYWDFTKNGNPLVI